MQSRVLTGADNMMAASALTRHGRGDTRSLSDEALLKRCAQGESAALEELVQRYQGVLYRFLNRLLGSPEDAEEAVLEVFVRAWQHAPRFEHRARVATWLYRIAVNIARDLQDRRKARPQTTSPEAYDLAQNVFGSAEEVALKHLERAERSRALERALRGLDDNDRLLLVLYYIEERAYPEIQAITGSSYTVLKTRLTRARRRLRILLTAQDPLDDQDRGSAQ